MRVLVTGGCGFIGSNIASSLLERGAKVFILDNFYSADFKNIIDLNCEVIVADIRDKDIFKKLPRLDAIIHQAAITDTTLKDEKLMMEVNYIGFKNVLEYCLKKKIKLIYASSAGVYGKIKFPAKETQKPNPLNIYAYSKYLCDREVLKLTRKSSIPIVGLRYFNVYGKGEKHKKKASSMIYQIYLQVKEGRSPRLFKYGEQRRDFVYIKDVVEATIKALSLKKVIILNVGRGEARSFNEIVNIFNQYLKKNLKPDYIDNPYSEVYQDYTCADLALIKKTLKFNPRYSLEEGIRDYLQYLDSSFND